MFIRTRTSRDTYTIRFVCDGCDKRTQLVRRIVGYPTPEAYALVESGEAVLKGCDIHEVATGDHECRECGHGTDVPDDFARGQIRIG